MKQINASTTLTFSALSIKPKRRCSDPSCQNTSVNVCYIGALVKYHAVRDFKEIVWFILPNCTKTYKNQC